MSSTIWAAVVTAIGSVLAASIPYFFTKKRQLEANQRELVMNVRQKKLEMYDDLVTALTLVTRGVYDPKDDYKTLNDLLMAFFKASVYASDNVVKEINNLLLLFSKHIEDQEVLK